MNTLCNQRILDALKSLKRICGIKEEPLNEWIIKDFIKSLKDDAFCEEWLDFVKNSLTIDEVNKTLSQREWKQYIFRFPTIRETSDFDINEVIGSKPILLDFFSKYEHKKQIFLHYMLLWYALQYEIQEDVLVNKINKEVNSWFKRMAIAPNYNTDYITKSQLEILQKRLNTTNENKIKRFIQDKLFEIDIMAFAEYIQNYPATVSDNKWNPNDVVYFTLNIPRQFWYHVYNNLQNLRKKKIHLAHYFVIFVDYIIANEKV